MTQDWKPTSTGTYLATVLVVHSHHAGFYLYIQLSTAIPARLPGTDVLLYSMVEKRGGFPRKSSFQMTILDLGKERDILEALKSTTRNFDSNSIGYS